MRAVVPAQTVARANRFYSPGVDAGDYVYISGQGPRRPDGSFPPTFSAQVRQALDNVKAIVESAGLDHGARRLHPGLSGGHQPSMAK